MKRKFLLLSAITLWATTTWGAGPWQEILLQDTLSKKRLYSLEVPGYVDTTGASPMEVALRYWQGAFTPVFDSLRYDNMQRLQATYWMAIHVHNRSHYQEWYLELHDPHVGAVAVYEWDSSTLRPLGKSGFYLPFNERNVRHKNHFFQLSIPTNQKRTLLVRMASPTFAKFYASIVHANSMVNYSLREYWFLGLYYGSLLILLVYNFVLFLSTKQRPFLWYSLFVGSCILNALREDGLGFQFFWPGYPGFNFYHFDLATLLVLGAFTGFSSTFLDIPQKAPLLFRWLLAFLVLYGVSHVLESYYYHAWNFNSYLYPIPFVLLFFTALHFARGNNQPAKLYLIGFTTFIAGVICFFLRVNGWLPDNVYFIYAPNFSVLFEVIIMSYALASKYRQQQELLRLSQQQEMQLLQEKSILDQQLIHQLAEQDKWKDSLNNALEKKVAARTQELHAKNEELQKAYQLLSYYKERLEQDWSKLDKEKWELSQQVNERIFENIKGKSVSFEAFAKVFPTHDACLHYLSELKWSQGYVCKQCGHTRYTKGDLPYSRKCTRCTHRETVTAGTLFHGVKIELTKAFYITHVTLLGNSASTLKELAEQLQLRTATCWNFKKKVELAKESHPTEPTWENILLQG